MTVNTVNSSDSVPLAVCSEDVPVFKVNYGNSTFFAVGSDDVTFNTVKSSLAVFAVIVHVSKVNYGDSTSLAIISEDVTVNRVNSSDTEDGPVFKGN